MSTARRHRQSVVSKFASGVVAAALVLSSLVAVNTPTVAAAAALAPGVPPIVDKPANAVTADALPTVQINGVVWDQVVVGDTVYAGGEFTRARPAGSPAGSNESTRGNMLSYNIRTGVMNAGFAPVVNGPVRVVTASPDGKRVYIGGSFTSVNGQARNRVAAFNTSDGSLVAGFAPFVDADVFGMTASNTAVYMGGWFGNVNGVSRQRLGAVSASTGATLGWAPTSDHTVRALSLNAAGDRVAIGGNFANINGSPAIGIASLDASTGAMYPFPVNTIIRNYGNSAGTYSLKTVGDKVYGTGYWFGGTGNFEGMFMADAYSGELLNMLDCHGDSYDAVPMNGLIYVVSHHHHCSNNGGFADTNPRTRYAYTSAVTSDITGVVQTNNQGGYANFAGKPSGSLVNWWPAMTTGTYTGQTQAAWTTEATDEYLVQGGEFRTVNGVAQQGLVRFAVPSLAPKKMGPAGAAADAVPTFRGITDSSVRVNFMTNWDRDNLSLNYAVHRVGVAAPVYTTSATSLFWDRPHLSFVDSGLTPGATYSYYVLATDADGNSFRSGYRTFTAGSEVTDQTPYSNQVVADGANNYWRLNEAAGNTSSVDWVSGNNLKLGTTAALGAAGAVIGSFDTAGTFDGTNNSRSASSTAVQAPQTFSAELWMKTTTIRGGKLLGFGNLATGNSGSYDRHVYMDNAGRLTFGVHPGSVRRVSTAKSYNDGQWHHVVASLSSAGITLYVDGMLVGVDSAATKSDDYVGYWRVGGDNMGGWPGIGSSNNFAGTIDDVAIYPSVLTRTQIRDHYGKSGRVLDVPPPPADPYGQSVMTDNPDIYWRLGDPSGSNVARDQSGNERNAAYSGDPQLAQPSEVTDDPAVTFDGINDLAASQTSVANPTTYSLEVWFKTTSQNGGKILGFGNSATGLSSSYDRHVYLDAQGRLNFGVYTGSMQLVTSTQPYNDAGWHHVVATQGATGMQLIVDGVLLGTNPTTTAQNYTGYWRVGGDSAWSGNAWFKGTIDEVAIYSVPLTLQQARDHYRASAAATNRVPVAAFTNTCAESTCDFDATTSADTDGTIASYAWNFGDGATGAGATPTHIFTGAGDHTVTLTVTDNGGATSVTTRQVTTTAANQAPVAEINKTCENLACEFDGSASADPDGTIANYSWNFGDGTSASGPTASHTYTGAGSYTVTLTVTDNAGKTGTVTEVVSVQAANTAPEASFTVTKTNLQVSVNGTGSSDPDGTISTYAWNFGDGATGSGSTATHTYAAAGDYTVTLTVTDNRGGTDTTTETVSVVAAANVAPDASFTSTVAGLTASFNGSGSQDPDGTIAGFAWVFGDGSTGTGASPSHAYAAAGSYTVTLTVTDDDGATDQFTATVTVSLAQVFALDEFNRTQARWGTADVGGAWTDSLASSYSTDGTSGVITITRGGSGPTVRLAGVSARDVRAASDITVDKLPVGGSYFHSVGVRDGGSQNYRGRMVVSPSGAVQLIVDKTTGAGTVALRTVNVAGFVVQPNQKVYLELTATGTTSTEITLSIWREGQTKPTTAQVVVTDTAGITSPGAVFINSYMGGGVTNVPVRISVDKFEVSQA